MRNGGSYGTGHTREQARAVRKRRRRRRFVRGAVRTAFWGLVLAGVFVFGLGVGREVGADREPAGESTTIVRRVPAITATMPTQTVVETRTVTRTAPARRPAARTAR